MVRSAGLSSRAEAKRRLGAEDPKASGALNPPGRGRTSDGMDPWQQTVETRLGELRGDVRQVLTATVGSAVFVLGALATGFFFLLGQVGAGNEKVVAKLEAISTQLADVKTDVAVLKVASETRR